MWWTINFIHRSSKNTKASDTPLLGCIVAQNLYRKFSWLILDADVSSHDERRTCCVF